MTALLCYAIDANTGSPEFGITADDTQARYVWPARGQQLFDDSRVQDIAGSLDEPPADALGWLEVAATNLGLTIMTTDPVTVDTLADAMAEARQTLNQVYSTYTGDNVPPTDPEVLRRSREAFDQTSADYSGFGEDEQDDDPEAMNNFVLQLLGGVDPEGPNGWILDAIDNPQDPNTSAPDFIRFPGVNYDAEYPEAAETPEEAATEDDTSPEPEQESDQ